MGPLLNVTLASIRSPRTGANLSSLLRDLDSGRWITRLWVET